MPEKVFAGVTILVDDEGFMTDSNQWTEDVARGLAADIGIEDLTDKHFQVLNFMRKEFAEKGTGPSLRKLKNESGVDTKTLYSLFPKGPAKKAALIAGITKPQGCI